MNHGNDRQFSSPSPGDGSSDDAARAVAEWPLLAMLVAGRPGVTPPRPDAAIAEEQTAPVVIPPAPPPPAAVEAAPADQPAPLIAMAPEPMREGETEPPRAPAVAAMPEPQPAVRPPSALEQLFSRAGNAGEEPPVRRAVFKQSGPPPLKTPGNARANGAAVTIEPRPREWRDVETVPDRLFDRVGGR